MIDTKTICMLIVKMKQFQILQGIKNIIFNKFKVKKIKIYFGIGIIAFIKIL